MVKYIYINSDGTVDCFNDDDCKVPELSGDLTKLHKIKKLIEEPNQRLLPETYRIINPVVYFKIANTDNILEMRITHLFKIAQYIIQPTTLIHFENDDI